MTSLRISESLEAKFQRLADLWRRETGHLSNFTKRIAHPAYLKIVGMGPAAVPILLRELQQAPGHWTTALHLITEADPVEEADAGDLSAIRMAWLRWGKEHGYPVGD